jgi:predicted kinase
VAKLAAVIVLLNGAFGIGKSTVARHLRERLPGSAIFDPELVGFVLQRLPTFVPLAGRGTDDFQDLPAWRRLSVRGIRLVRRRRETVIVPMAFTNLAYLRELQDGARAVDPDVRHFCLTAPYEVVKARLASRGPNAWVLRRAAECCLAHGRPEFEERVPTEVLPAEAVAAEIVRRLERATART